MNHTQTLVAMSIASYLQAFEFCFNLINSFEFYIYTISLLHPFLPLKQFRKLQIQQYFHHSVSTYFNYWSTKVQYQIQPRLSTITVKPVYLLNLKKS